MRILAIGDPHFMVSNLDTVKIFIKKVKKLIEEQNPDLVVVLGDLLHTHEKIHSSVLRYATRFLREISEIVPVYLIIGNHDATNNQIFLNNNHAFNSFKNWENLTVCDRVKEFIGEKKLIFCPYVPPGRFREALDTFPGWETADLIFAHQEFKGCSFNPVAVSEHGDEWSDDLPMVVSGHIHNEQWVGDNIYYPGSSMQHAFGETPNKTVIMINFSKGPKFKKFGLGMRPKKIVYLEISELESFKKDPNCDIKLVLKGTSEEFKTFRKSKNYHEITKDTKVSFIPKESDINVSSVSRKKSVVEILKELIIDEADSVKEALETLLKD